jgi:hypothetical protein
VGTPLTVVTSGGSGTGAVTFAVTGSGCTINAQTGALSDSAAGTCSVTATKAADANYHAATSAAVTFTFSVAGGGGGGGGGGDTPTFQNPDVATMTSVTGGINATPIDDTANGDTYFIDQYYSTLDHWNFTYILPGASITETWHVNGSDGKPLANQAVTLEPDFSYGGLYGNTGTETFWTPSGVLTGTTNADGNVTFNLTNNDTSATYVPADTTKASTGETAEAHTAWSRMALIVGSDTITSGTPATSVNEASDLVDFIVVKS